MLRSADWQVIETLLRERTHFGRRRASVNRRRRTANAAARKRTNMLTHTRPSKKHKRSTNEPIAYYTARNHEQTRARAQGFIRKQEVTQQLKRRQQTSRHRKQAEAHLPRPSHPWRFRPSATPAWPGSREACAA
eukprot:4624710-Pleurochrysis_carterae.AAC.1